MEGKQMNFHKTFQQLRKSAGLSQEELGEKLGVSRQTISKWESASAYPDMINLVTISQYFEISVDELISGESHGEEATDEVLRQTDDSALSSDENEVFHYEYKSRITVKDIPLVHINYGFGGYRAKGIVAIGNISTGLLSIGIIAKGFISMGVLSAGLLAFGVLSIGLFAVGCIALGLIAIAGIAVGIMTLGGLAAGIVSIGGCSVATHVAVGGVAIAPVSIGYVVNGDSVIALNELGEISTVSSQKVIELIEMHFPNMPAILKSWATLIFM